MKNYIYIILFCLFPLHAYSQYWVKVLDENSNIPVADASIYFPDTKAGTTTNESGLFSINTKGNTLLVQISSINYKTYLGTIKLKPDTTYVLLESSTHELQEITISSGSSKLQGENVINVENINLSKNPTLEGISLTQKLTEIAGVSNYSTGTGIGKPVIRGLTGNRIAVFSQGIRIENQQWGDEHGLGLDENGYEQVEVIKGPASLLYGSDALGGVLYFVGERYAKENTLEADVHSEYNTNTDGWRNAGAFKISKKHFHWNLFGGYTTHKDYQDGEKNEVNNSRFNTTDIKTTLGYTAGNFTTSLKYNYLNEKYGLVEERESGGTYHNGRTPGLPYQILSTHLFSSENTIFFNNASKLKIDLGYIINNRKEFEEEEQPALDMNLSTLSYNIKWIPDKINKWSWIIGSQGMCQTNKNAGEEILIPDAATIDAGLYATTDYHYGEHSYWQVGLRLDARNINGKENGTTGEEGYMPSFNKTYSAINFSTGVFQQIFENLSMRASLSSGYRAPSMFELLSDGVHEGTNRYEIGNEDLKTENSYQADISFDYKTEHFNVFVNPYFNYIRNYIYLQPSGEIKEELPVYNYTQTDACLFGGEAGFHYHPHPLDWLHLQASYATTYGQDTHKNDLPLMPSSKINSMISANFSWEKVLSKFSVFAQYQYSFKQNHIATYETPTDAYSLVNAGVHFEFNVYKQNISFDTSVNNLFDTVYYDHLSRYKAEGIYNIGRNVVFKLSIPISVKLVKS